MSAAGEPTGDGRHADDVLLAVLTGRSAPPQANGELVFAAPSEGRLWGMAHALVNAGQFDWDTFRAALIAAIADADAEIARAPDTPFDYYACFGRALETLLAVRGLLDARELDARTAVIAARPHGHDHGPAA